jgi:hypothetical protein
MELSCSSLGESSRLRTRINVSAIYIAKFMKHIGHTWYILHAGIMLVSAAGTIAAFVIVILYKTPPHFTGAHRVHVSHLDYGASGCDYNVLSDIPWHYYQLAIRPSAY